MTEVGSLQDAALKRKERLKAMRQKEKTDTDLEPPAKKLDSGETEKLPRPMFRSYKPRDERLQESLLPKAKPQEVVEKIQDQLEAAKPEPLVEEVDLTSLAPRKPDWDLKRDITLKLEKLERRTQRAIAELIRERLQSGEEDLATAVNAAPTQVDDDDE